MAIEFDNINTATVDLAQAATNALSPGWHKMALVEVEDVKKTKNGNAVGARFTFQALDGPDKGLTFRPWFCVQAKKTDMAWSQKRFVNTFVRIAQCVGVANLNSTNELIGKPFYCAIITKTRQYTSNEVDAETGDFVQKTTTDNDFQKGKLTETFLSCADYAAKFGGANNADFSFQFNPQAVNA